MYKIFFLSSMISIIAINLMAYINLVWRMGLPLSPDIFVGPTFVGLLMGSALTMLIGYYLKRITNIEITKLHEFEEVQREIIYKMGEIGECRSAETGFHVRRVAEYSILLASYVGLTEDEICMLKNASPMHDIGKVGVPDTILLKPGKLTESEYEIMKTHAQLGYDILKNTGKTVFEAAATVAYEHHERWDGGGYPRALKGEEIHIYGRITAIADVFDALINDRVYKRAWEAQKVKEYLLDERGRHFDPQLVDIMVDNYQRFLDIKEKYRD